jgi:HAMP domain-containing protein
MSGITRLIQNLSIGVKLGIASGLGVLLVATMVIVQVRSNAAMRDLDARMSGQQTIARDAVEVKASVAGMQIAVRDLRLANNSADMQKAVDSLAAKLKSANHYSDEMLRISKAPENRARIEKLKARAGDYAKGAQQIVAVRTEAIAAAGGADAAAKITKLNEEVMRIARDVTLPIVAELDPLASQIAEVAKHNLEAESAQGASEMATAEWEALALGIGTILLLIGSSIFSYFTISRPMRALSVSMEELAGGNFAVVLPGLGRKDELGAVAGAVEKFKVVSEQKAREEAEAKIRQDQVAAQQRKADMVKLANSFEAAVGEIVETVSSASTELEASAGTLTSTAERAQEVTTMVAAASEEASTNVQSVASATEELSSSVNEISRQVQ